MRRKREIRCAGESILLRKLADGRGDTLPRDPKAIGSNDFICASLPLFKRAFDKRDGVLVTIDDFETASRAYRAMFQKLFDTVPNITPEKSALGGFSNGAHMTALLLGGQAVSF